MGINSLTATISEDGIKYQGSLFGANSPEIDQSLTSSLIDPVLKVHAKVVHIVKAISANGNNILSLPVAVASGKGVLFVDKKAYFPGKDFNVIGSSNKLEWINGTKTILTTSDVLWFAPANQYTADCFTFKVFDLTDSEVFTLEDGDFDDKPTIFLDDEAEQLPYNEKSIFLFIDHKLYSPVVTPETDFDYDVSDKKIVWNLQDDIELNITDTVAFAFYYNQKDIDPNLGSLLTRVPLLADDDNDNSYSLSVIPKANLVASANLFHFPVDSVTNRNRGLHYNKGAGDTGVTAKDYKVVFPTLTLPSTSRLKELIATGDNIDFSYFSDPTVLSVVSMINQYLNSGTTPEAEPDDNIYKTAFLPINVAVELKKTFLFLNGLLATRLTYDNYANITTSFSGILPEYTLESLSYIKWDSTSRSVIYPTLPPSIPISGDKFTFKALVDSLSIANTKVDYFHRTTSLPASDNIVLANEVKNNKLIMWYNGAAHFCQTDFEDFTLNGDNKTIALSSTGHAVPPSGFIDEIIIWSIIDDAYSELWFFDGYVHSGATTTSGVTEIELANAISDKDVSFLFKNGGLIANNKFTIASGSGNKKIILTDDTLQDVDKLMLVHI